MGCPFKGELALPKKLTVIDQRVVPVAISQESWCFPRRS